MNAQFVIIGAPRTGSTLLVRTLNSLPNICCHGELLQLQMVRGLEDGFDPIAATEEERKNRAARLIAERAADPVDFIRTALTSDFAATGFKVTYGMFFKPEWQNVVTALIETPALKFIHLTRANDLRRYVSEQILEAGGPIHSEAGGRSEQTMKIDFDFEHFRVRREEMHSAASDVRALLQGKSVLELTYEALASDTAGAIASTCDFIGVDADTSSLKPALKKVGAADLRDAVNNYDELQRHELTREMLEE